ncbi:MAG: hypothetical protein WC647_06615 [Desulfomonilaceae bacterium]|jgi:hypothetical protein
MGSNSNVKILQPSGTLPLFEKVDHELTAGNELLDEAIILDGDSEGSGSLFIEATLLETTSPSDETSHDSAGSAPHIVALEPLRTYVGLESDILPAPLIPMSLAVILFMLMITFGNV